MHRAHLAYCLASLSALVPAPAWGQTTDGTGLKTSIAVDMVGSFKADKDSAANDRLEMRGAEATFFAPVDHLFDGLLSLAAHPESGETVFEVHEATLSTTKLVPRSKIKVGQFFLGVGRLNRTHQHDWAFVSAPVVHRTYFGDEGALDSGVEYSWLLPTATYLDLTVGVTNGWVYGHAHNEGEKPRRPTHYARLATFAELGEGGLQAAANYLGRQSSDGEETRLVGIDAVAKWKNGRVTSWLIQSEAWQRLVQPPAGDQETSAGAYAFIEYGLSESTAVGTRFDYFSVLSLKDVSGDAVGNSIVAVVPTLTYKPSEFSRFRLAYDHKIIQQDGLEDRTDPVVETQAVFIMGAHPAHDF
jgi:hypothetical protein